MKIQYEVSDVPNMIGRFYIQLNFDNQDVDITISNKPTFWLEKRISFFAEDGKGGIISQGLYYFKTHSETHQKFVDDYLHYYKDRFYRPLNIIELRWLAEKMAKPKELWGEN